VPVGRVEQGVLKPGGHSRNISGGFKAEVKSIEMHHQALPQAIPGDNIGFALKGVEKNQLARGMVVTKPDTPIPVAKEFLARYTSSTTRQR
jgi:elongation factor 1-alpha